MKIVCQQTILMKYHALFVIFEKSGKIWNCRLLQIIGASLRVKSFLVYALAFSELSIILELFGSTLTMITYVSLYSTITVLIMFLYIGLNYFPDYTQRW